MTNQPVPKRTDRGLRAGLGAAVGILTTGVALGVAELVAGILRSPQASPIVAVGDAMVDLSPQPVKEFAIATFGVYDKIFLLSGISVAMIGFAVLLGIVALVRPTIGQIAIALFAVVGVVAVFARRDFTPLALMPPIVGAGAGSIALRLLQERAVELHPAWGGGTAAAPAGANPDSDADDTGDTGASAPVGTETTGSTETTDTAEPTGTARRAFVLAGAGAAAVTLLGGGIGRYLLSRADIGSVRSALRLPKAAKPLPPLPEGVDLGIKGLTPFSTPSARFYRIDTALTVPQVDPNEWSLRIHGLVDKPVEIDFDTLLKRTLIEADVSLTCVSNPVGGDLAGNTRWLGVRLDEILREAGVQRDADQILSTSVDGWTCGTPVEITMDGREAMLAVAMGGEALRPEHGFPVRMMVPGLYGYVSATKWVTDIKLTRFADERAYWADRGWSVEGPIKTQSRIDVPTPLENVKPGKVTVAGVAWAQHRGIDAVELRVDGGEWSEATLATVPNIDTWRQWTWDWDASGSGRHKIEVRATDAAGYTQTGKLADTVPNGATGWHSVLVNVE